jgi:hypothetical protein
MNEIDRAEKIHPVWPRDVVKAASLCSEECGELVRAANTFDETRTGRKDIGAEAIQHRRNRNPSTEKYRGD